MQSSIMKKFKEIQGNAERQFKKLRNKISNQKGYFTRDWNSKREPNINSSRAEELKNETKYALEIIGNRTDHKEAIVNL